MPHHRRGIARVSLVAAPLAGLLPGCAADPRPDIPTTANATAAAATTVEFRSLGPDGGPLDGPEPRDGALPLGEAMRLAVAADPALQMALARVRAAEAEADQARLLPNPVVSLVLRWGGGPPQIEAGLAQELAAYFRRGPRARAADHRLRAAAADAVTAAIDVVAEVEERYAAAQAAGALVPILRDRLGLMDRLVMVARSRLEAGEGTRGDLATLEAERVEVQVEIDHALLSERQERLRLARLIGTPTSPAGWPLDGRAEPPSGLPPEPRWIEAALGARPELQAAAWRAASLGEEAAAARALLWEGSSAGVDAQKDGGWTVGPSVAGPIPVFDTGSATRARLEADRQEALHALTQARRRVVEEVRLAYEGAASATANLRRLRGVLLPLQQQRRDLAESSYRAGVTDVTALYLAEQDLRAAQAKAIELELQSAAAWSRLRRAVGGPGPASELTPASSPTPTPTSPASTAHPADDGRREDPRP